jgi:aminoglycoside phosphotransferase (APT) family kinase protein
VPDPDQIARTVDPRARLLRTWPLRGGMSSSMMGLEIALPDGATRRLIVRRPSGWALQRSPRAAADEFELLKHTRAAGLPTSVPIHLDDSGADAFFVIEFIDGATEFSPADMSGFIGQLASTRGGRLRVIADVTRPDIIQRI